MAINPDDTKARKSIGKFARALLATTCLTVASGAAVAGTITYSEGTSPAPSDFSNTFAGASASALSAAAISGTTTITGEVTNSDRFDYIELTGLGTGTFTVDVADTEGGGSINASIFNSGDTSLGGPTPFSTSVHADFASQAIPLDGDLVIDINNLGEIGNFYTVTVNTTASAAPEPGTLLTAGLGLAGALALTRRRRKQS
jgi:MYXO-CTERM domain-containing protein